jgi:GNAT superfamily N-acetyltransferase
MAGVQVQRQDIDSPLALELIGELNEELSARYPEEGATHFRLDAEEVAPGRGAFLVAYVDGQAAGCGAVRLIADGAAELKRMYVRQAVRGRGIGAFILAALEAEALLLGISRLVLETGDRQPEALALYGRAGFAVTPPFGEYVDSPLSICMAKELR